MARGPKKPKAGRATSAKTFNIAKVAAPRANRKDGKVARWNTKDDIPEDNEDAFHRQRDQILLQGGVGIGGGNDGYAGDDVFGGDEHEVLALRPGSDDEADDEEMSDELGQDRYDEEEAAKGRRRIAKEKRAASKAVASPAAPKKAGGRLGTPDSSDEDDEQGEEDSDAESSSSRSESAAAQANGFGRNKHAYYSGNNLDAIESDSELDEETKRELEVREAKKMQALAREGMDDEDFGFPSATSREGARIILAGIEPNWKDKRTGFSSGSKEDQEKRRREFDNVAETAEQTLDKCAVEVATDSKYLRENMFAQLEKTSPETIALSGELPDIAEEYAEAEATLQQRLEGKHSKGSKEVDAAGHGLIHLHHQAINAYVTNLAFYFYLRSLSEYAEDPAKLRAHPVMERLLKFKKTLAALEDLGIGGKARISPHRRDIDGLALDNEDEDEEEVNDEEGMLMDDVLLEGGSDDSEELEDMDDDELADLLADEDQNGFMAATARNGASANNFEGREAFAGAGEGDAEAKTVSTSPAVNSKSKKDRKKKSKGKVKEVVAPAPLAALAAYDYSENDDFASILAASSIAKGKKRQRDALGSIPDEEAAHAFGEPTQLTAQEEAEKAARKRSLKFYTSQISAKEARKGAGQSKRDRLSGDADIPYRDKSASRDAVERARQAASGGSADSGMGAALDGSEWDAKDVADRSAVLGFAGAEGDFGEEADGGDNDAEGYYDLVTNRRRAAKRQKQEEYDAMREEIRNIYEPTLADGEHRAINRTIEKNKGLTPFRPKAVRNPRVKKRQRYDKAKKKLGSMQAVYKGGLGSLEGGYQGEKSGISSNVVKSRKFA
ncbi:hypothetical protein K437DRAFT_290192 [Tilletiaria anomala UBC 951]|uniref:Sas10 C-terminal domain-containing protein n=1 Tax=Tilletiaria anomala (strain ATCC 24038 / CBS 436.72 / UBC 951) TaxID=1037660 RepID=A0A066WL33_TILAU|nr:uncharacterized protein K437DRAFT_290192 [Tilletiaria anomala UBC 951]KDN51325.1 hypothetical protein K437DRAFT_290192 [Tilletiaria anomala UBC 951]